ncbi:MAG: AGE family epimerase/isomerase, partial [Spirochaetaceae bacterium]|nr:AGE family epimerase/isomerase [Spirochaetaceae bacterium]
MTKARIAELRDFYLRELRGDTLPFWIEKGIDREHGGLLDFLDREGRPLSTDKGGWIQGRFTWVLSRAANSAASSPEERARWMEAARLCADFVRDKVLAGPDGRAYFELDGEGRPLVLRRYLFAEAFAVIGLAEYARALGPAAGAPYLAKALETLAVLEANRGKLAPKIDPATRRLRGHSETMILINVFQVLRDADPARAADYTRRIDAQIEELFRWFVKPELRVLLETVNEDGSLAEGCEGRCVNPGHCIETAWFIMEEGRRRGDESLVRGVLPILEWSLERGWDAEFGGLFSFVDLEGRRPAQIEWDMKYWWPHCEATYGCLLAYALTGEPKWERWFETLHDYTWRRFPDPAHGEWFGYLRRDGSVANDVKGNHYKGAFHVPRFELYAGLLLDAMH